MAVRYKAPAAATSRQHYEITERMPRFGQRGSDLSAKSPSACRVSGNVGQIFFRSLSVGQIFLRSLERVNRLLDVGRIFGRGCTGVSDEASGQLSEPTPPFAPLGQLQNRRNSQGRADGDEPVIQ